jgi:chromosome condensin MukBEF complex kleisin-like MukF subunit
MSQDPQPNSDAPSPFDNIIDDVEPRDRCLHWLMDEMIAGRTPEELTDNLLNDGWSTDDTAELVETARRLTRQQRGVVTRDDVVADANRNYRRSMHWFITFPTIAAAIRLFYSLATLSALRKRPKRRINHGGTENTKSKRGNNLR